MKSTIYIEEKLAEVDAVLGWQASKVNEMWLGLANRHLPFQMWRDRMYVSPEALPMLSVMWQRASQADPALHGLEMRLERWP